MASPLASSGSRRGQDDRRRSPGPLTAVPPKRFGRGLVAAGRQHERGAMMAAKPLQGWHVTGDHHGRRPNVEPCYGSASISPGWAGRPSPMRKCQKPMAFMTTILNVTEPGRVRVFQCAVCEKLDFKPEG
jgi:hypothetical protein